MKDECSCYIEDRQLVDYTPLMRPIYKIVSLCFGTKERDRCTCGGDKTKCDFYPEVREKAKAEIGEDSLIVTYDCCPSDAASLCVARKEKDKIRVLNIIHGDEAFGMYHCLTGGAELKNMKDIPKKPIGDLNSVPHYRCPSCNGAVVMYCDDHKYPCCQWCGQALDWN